jgi:phospholipid transport system substrate-binding protein
MTRRGLQDHIMPQIARRAFVLGLATAGIAAPRRGSAQGTRDSDAEAFVQSGAQRIISILADKHLDHAGKEAAFRRAIDELTDVPRITRFVLGKYARTVTPAEYADFAVAFREYVERVYRNRLDSYNGEVLQVTGSTVRKPGDVIVRTRISGGKMSEPVEVSWRVLGAGGSWRIVDAEFKGVWLAITQQQDFVSTMDNAHGDIRVLIDRLNRPAGAGKGG